MTGGSRALWVLRTGILNPRMIALHVVVVSTGTNQNYARQTQKPSSSPHSFASAWTVFSARLCGSKPASSSRQIPRKVSGPRGHVHDSPYRPLNLHRRPRHLPPQGFMVGPNRFFLLSLFLRSLSGRFFHKG